MTPPWQGADEAIFRQLHTVWRNPALDPIFRSLTDPGKLLVPLGLVLLGFLWMERRRGFIALLVLAVTITASDQLCSKVLKPIFARQRPSVVIVDSKPMFGPRGSYSFPSVHASNSFAAAVVLDAVFPGARVGLLVLASLISYSRIYVGDHWPSDVLAGALIGSLLGWCGRQLFLVLAARLAPAPVRRDAGMPSAAP